jgi:hypothetical protein
MGVTEDFTSRGDRFALTIPVRGEGECGTREGPSAEAPPASASEAQPIANADPAVRAGRLMVRLGEWWVRPVVFRPEDDNPWEQLPFRPEDTATSSPARDYLMSFAAVQKHVAALERTRLIAHGRTIGHEMRQE